MHWDPHRLRWISKGIELNEQIQSQKLHAELFNLYNILRMTEMENTLVTSRH